MHLQAHLGLPYVHTYSEADVPQLHTYVDFVTCLGGDGLILHASLLFRRAIPPIISFKLGSLGFLTCHDFDDFRGHLTDVINGCDVGGGGRGCWSGSQGIWSRGLGLRCGLGAAMWVRGQGFEAGARAGAGLAGEPSTGSALGGKWGVSGYLRDSWVGLGPHRVEARGGRCRWG